MPTNENPPEAALVLGCDQLDPTLRFFTDVLGFQLDLISPADSPSLAVVSGHGLRLRLDTALDSTGASAATLRIAADDATIKRLGSRLVAPNGTVVEIVTNSTDPVLPPAQPVLEVSRFADAGFEDGRAGMGYRDLMPQRQGGRYIASHIRIETGGRVADYVHFHRIRFQMIYCRAGWARLVYEDQGPPFILNAGDCVLQPPEIRHQVLESSAGLEVVEVGCPAVHDTLTDPSMELPTPQQAPARRFGGQAFVRHVAADASWVDDGCGLRHQDFGIGSATDGLATARLLSRMPDEPVAAVRAPSTADFYFLFLTEGEGDLCGPDNTSDSTVRLAAGDAVALPPGADHSLERLSADFEALEVTVDRAALGQKTTVPAT